MSDVIEIRNELKRIRKLLEKILKALNGEECEEG